MAMTGCRNFVYSEKEQYVTMKLTANKLRAQWLRIRLTSLDLYTMEFIKMANTGRKGFMGKNEREPRTIKTIEGVYDDMLRELFEKETGLVTRMPRVIGINC